MTTDNRKRAEYARAAIRSHQWAKGEAIEETDTAVIDLLADLRHYCDVMDLCFWDCDRIAYDHHDAERSVTSESGL